MDTNIEPLEPPEFFLFREPSTPDGTFGAIWSSPTDQLCVTVEKPWADNQEGISCIPAGSYIFRSYESPTKGPVWRADDNCVEPRCAIEIHAANLASELLGCIAPGRDFAYFDDVRGVTSSRMTMAYLRGIFPDVFKLTISQP